MSAGYKNISQINNVKYKGLHPLEKKKFIKNTNSEINEFNKYWSKNINKEISYAIKDLFAFDENGGETLQELLKDNGVEVSLEEIKSACEKNKINKPEKEKVLKDVSDGYRTKVKNFIKDVTQATPEATIQEKNEEVDGFFEKILSDETDEKIKAKIEKVIGQLLANEFKPIVKEEKNKEPEELKNDKNAEKLITRLSASISRSKDVDNKVKRKSISSLQALKKSMVNDDPSTVKKESIKILKAIIRILVEYDPKLKQRILKEQKKLRNVKDVEKNLELVQKEVVDLANNPRTSKPSSITSSVETINENVKSIIAPPAAPKLEDMPPLPAGKSSSVSNSTNKTNSSGNVESFKEQIKNGRSRLKSKSKPTPTSSSNKSNNKEKITKQMLEQQILKLRKIHKDNKSAMPPKSEKNLTDMLNDVMKKRRNEAEKNGELEKFIKEQEEEAKRWADDEKENEIKPKKQAPPLPPRGKSAKNKTTSQSKKSNENSKTAPSRNKPSQNQPHINMSDFLEARRANMGYNESVEEEEDDNTTWD